MAIDMTKLASNLITVKGNAEVSSAKESKPSKKKPLLIKLNEQQANKLKEAVYKTDKTRQDIMIEGLELWFQENGI